MMADHIEKAVYRSGLQSSSGADCHNTGGATPGRAYWILRLMRPATYNTGLDRLWIGLEGSAHESILGRRSVVGWR